MDCKEIQLLLPAYLTGEMAEIQQIRIRKHLATCEVCAHKLEEEQALNSLLDGWELELPQFDISQQVMGAIDSPKVFELKPKKPFGLVTDLVAAGAAALIIFFSAFGFFNEMPQNVGQWSQTYMSLSLDTMDTFFSYVEDFEILKEEMLND